MKLLPYLITMHICTAMLLLLVSCEQALIAKDCNIEHCVCNVKVENGNVVQECSGMGLDNFPQGPEQTTQLNMRHNKINHLTQKIVHDVNYPNLHYLDVSHNGMLDVEPNAFDGSSMQSTLEKLDLNNNALTSYTAIVNLLKNVPSLRTLDLLNNPQMECGKLIQGLQHVKQVLCDDFGITITENAVVGNPPTQATATTSQDEELATENDSSQIVGANTKSTSLKLEFNLTSAPTEDATTSHDEKYAKANGSSQIGGANTTSTTPKLECNQTCPVLNTSYLGHLLVAVICLLFLILSFLILTTIAIFHKTLREWTRTKRGGKT